MGQFDYVQNLSPGRSVFDLSYDKKLTCDMGQLIPIVCEEMVPGDRFQLAHEIVARMQPLVAPVLHEINVFTHTFFVPYRILWENWEEWISGGPDGDYDLAGDPIPEWIPSVPVDGTVKGSLWDYLGLPIQGLPAGLYPIDFPRRAYNLIYNEFYRDENLQDEVPLSNEAILNRSYQKDYFTSALPWQQRGQAPAIPLTGSTSATWANDVVGSIAAIGGGAGTLSNLQYGNAPTRLNDAAKTRLEADLSTKIPKDNLGSNTVDLSAAETFNVNDIRTAVQIQKWLERNARGGVRYVEFLKMHFNVYPRDDRLQRPEYVGGTKMPIVISEVLQTSGTPNDPDAGYTGDPLGEMGGHGITADFQFSGNINAQEYGLVMTLMSIMPAPGYQQGINRQWLRKTRYDFFFPEFAHLSEQAILQGEIYVQNDANENTKIFGYQGRYDEMRVKHNMVCAGMRDTFDYWHLSRKFATAPLLNETFIKVDPDENKRIFAVQDEPGFIMNIGNKIKAVRPMPAMATPGLMDHF